MARLRSLLYVLALSGVLVVTASWLVARHFGRWSRAEVARVPAPSGHTEAVLVETNGGATTSFGYEVFLVKAGESSESGVQVASFYGALRSDSAYGVNLRWVSADTLALEYLQAHSAGTIARAVRQGGRHVQVLLRGGIEDPRAPAGGMEYNLSR